MRSPTVMIGGLAATLRMALLMALLLPAVTAASMILFPTEMLVFVTQKRLRCPIDEMGRAAGGALQQDKTVAWRIRIIFDPVLHVLMSDGTAKHDAGHCSSICPAPALVVTQINVELLFFGWLQRAFVLLGKAM